MPTPVLTVTPLDVHDDRQAAAAYAVVSASRAHERPWDDLDGLAPTLAEWRYDNPAERAEMWLVADGGGVAGVAQIWFPQLDNLDKLWFEVHVAPGRRRRGVGTRLVEHVLHRAAQEGRREVLTESFVPADVTPDHPHERFAAHTGFGPSSTDRIRRLALPVPGPRLDELAEAARPHWDGRYRLETYADGLPEPLVAGYCRVSNLLGVDAPTGAVDFEAESMTPEHYRDLRALERAQGRHRLTTVALTADTGAVVAYTDLVLPAGAPQHVWQWGTLVDRDHRGHRLGTAVKVANVRRLQQDHPERKLVTTGNDETNAWMVSINEALGFELVELCRMHHRVLAD
jgi:GNAT superfamily N-acetyltransferase